MADAVKYLKWDQDGERVYETGVEQAVLFVKGKDKNGKIGYKAGVAWNGLTGVTESPSGAEATPLYANNKKYLNLLSSEEFGGTIEAYTYPDEFAECNGEANLGGVAGVVIGQQSRKEFGFAYKSMIGNDVEQATANGDNYKLHIVYNCLAAPSERAYATINETPEAITFSWEFSTTKVDVAGAKPTAVLTIDTTKLTDGKDNAALKKLEEYLYGTAGAEGSTTPTQWPYLPTVDEIAGIFNTTQELPKNAVPVDKVTA